MSTFSESKTLADEGGLLVDGMKKDFIRIVRDEFQAVYDWRKRASAGNPGRPPVSQEVWDSLAERMGNGMKGE